MPWVQRDDAGRIRGICTGPVFDAAGKPNTEFLADDHPDVIARRAELSSQSAPPRRLSSYRIVRRIEAAGKLAEAQAILDANAGMKWRFITAPGILVDDPDLVAGIKAIGLDPAEILAAE